MYRISLLTISLLTAASALGVASVAGPDGKLLVSVDVTGDGEPVYGVSYDGKPFITSSPLGLLTNIGDFSRGLLLSDVSDAMMPAVSYSLPNIKKSRVDYEANEAWFTFAKDSVPRVCSASSASAIMTWLFATRCCRRATLAVP